MCKHEPSNEPELRLAGWQPYEAVEIVAGTERRRSRGIIGQQICTKCGMILGLPKTSPLSWPYRKAAAALSTRHDLSGVQRRLISQKLRKLDDGGLSRTRREGVFIDAFATYSAIPEDEILATVVKI